MDGRPRAPHEPLARTFVYFDPLPKATADGHYFMHLRDGIAANASRPLAKGRGGFLSFRPGWAGAPALDHSFKLLYHRIL